MDGNGEAGEQERYGAAISEYWDSDQLTVESCSTSSRPENSPEEANGC